MSTRMPSMPGPELADLSVGGPIIPEQGQPRRRAPIAEERSQVERLPLPRQIRQAVLIRDAHTCQKCRCHPSRPCHAAIYDSPSGPAFHFGGTVPITDAGPRILEIDHILPWSAGGADHPVNLRTLCRDCNQDRSNYYDQERDRQVQPIAWNCLLCKPELNAVLSAVDLDLRDVFCMACSAPSRVPHLARYMAGGKIPTTGVPTIAEVVA